MRRGSEDDSYSYGYGRELVKRRRAFSGNAGRQ